MATKFNNSLSNSLKGKIWLATTALAFFICTFGILSYLLSSFLINDTFYAVVIPFLFITITVVGFGWWISNEVVNPVERVLLVAKSLERGTSTSIPKTSGSAETDDLLQTLYRISQQAQKLLDSMEAVAQGNLDLSVAPISNSDRITVTFQKLLTKVSESIHAKQDLEKLESGIQRLTSDVAGINHNNINLVINSEMEETAAISTAFSHLLEQLRETISQVRISSAQAQNSSAEARRNLEAVIQQDESRIHEMNQASLILRKMPQLVQKISDELSRSAFSATQSIEKARNGANISQANLNAVTQLRKQINESVKRTQKLNESSQEISKIAKTVEDLAHRTNMVALNASIQAAELNEQGRGFAIVSEEVENLAERANQTNKHISNLNKSIQTEINNVENTLETTISEVANLSRFAIETGKLIEDLERYIGQFLTLQEQIISYTHEQTDDTEKAFQTFVEAIPETEKSVNSLKEAARSVEKVSNSMESLQNAVSHFNTAPTTFQSAFSIQPTSAKNANIFESEPPNIFEPDAGSIFEPDSPISQF
ncbi:MAG TPA: methyl-accepting chemotaxis protein [Pyrinomonadaceae bacterium]|nr:methyl-accepting chemotaxis protein [Pyrinomonadaceae bacterium]